MKIYLVGGAVRDQLLGLAVHERDWVVVGAQVEEMLAQGFIPVGKDFPVFIHTQSGDEYALARTERKSGKGYTGFICYSSPDVTLEEDLLRRDLTINAMAVDPDASTDIIDPYGGQADLQSRLLRHVSPAFTEDPLRVLRVARFAARFFGFGFRVAPETLQLMQEIAASGELDHLVAERIWKETERSLSEAHAEIFFDVLHDCAALAPIFPEWLDNYSSHRELLQRACAKTDDSVLRLAFCLQHLSADKINPLAKRLRFPNHYRDACLVLSEHVQLINAPHVLSATKLMMTLEKLDALRRPQRLEWLCGALHIVHGDDPLSAQLRNGLTIIAAVDATLIAAQGVSGKALGEALRQARLVQLQDIYHD
jgi:tRNA nucleotidyltransferase (CCA-adding enzyme)